MSEIVNKLRAEAETDCVAYTEFMLSYQKKENIIYTFFEGFEDRYYYPIRIEHIMSNIIIRDFICYGKENVLKVYNLIKQSSVYSNCKSAFFVDSDFDTNNYPNEIYKTPTYSIENLYTTESCLEKILISEFKFKRDTNDFTKCKIIYTSLILKFLSDIEVLNVWLACQADIRNEENILTRLKIDKKLKGVISKEIINEDLNSYININSINSIEKIEAIFPEAPKISLERFNKKLEAFKEIDKRLKFRGKFSLKFLEIFLIRLQSIDYTKNKIFENAYSSSMRVEYNTLCSNLSQYAETPSCLRTYLQSIN